MDWIMEDGKITHLIFTDINIPKMPIMLMNQLVPHVIFNEIVMLLFQIVNMKPEMQFRPNIKHLKFLRYRNTVITILA